MDVQSTIARLEELKQAAVARIGGADSGESVEEARISFLGRKSELALISKSFGDLSADGKRALGKVTNEVRSVIEDALAKRISEITLRHESSRLESERIDVTLPGRAPRRGSLHPLTLVLEEVIDVFLGLGFTPYEGPIVETDWYNFESLNIPKDHSARSMHDTFYVDSAKPQDLVLRTHTSPMQMRIMESTPPPIYAVVPGVVVRRETVDANHLAVFHQIEGLAVDEGISFADLKGTLEKFAKAMFGSKLTVRLHPSYFPFTEPSAEIYVLCWSCEGSGCRVCRGEGWIEIMGAGMVHPNVFRAAGYDPDISGFAFGMGTERVAKLRYEVTDLRFFYENDVRFLERF